MMGFKELCCRRPVFRQGAFAYGRLDVAREKRLYTLIYNKKFEGI